MNDIYTMFIFGVMIWVLFRSIELVGRRFWLKGRVCLVRIDPDSNGTWIGYHKLTNGNEVLVPGNAQRPNRRYILERVAGWHGRFPTWIIHARHGGNYVAAGDAEDQNDRRIRELRVSNPESYDYAIRHNEARDFMETQSGKDDLVTRAMPWIIVGLFLVLATVVAIAYMVYAVYKAG